MKPKVFQPNKEFGGKEFSAVADVRLKDGRVVTVQGYGRTEEEAVADLEAVMKKVLCDRVG